MLAVLLVPGPGRASEELAPYRGSFGEEPNLKCHKGEDRSYDHDFDLWLRVDVDLGIFTRHNSQYPQSSPGSASEKTQPVTLEFLGLHRGFDGRCPASPFSLV
jgi:hypothetical protein